MSAVRRKTETMSSFFLQCNDSDRAYANVRDNPSCIGWRTFVEDLWERYKPYADRHFLRDAVSHFQERFWEMYLGVTLLEHEFTIERVSNTGPDFYIRDRSSGIWIEAVAPGSGEGPDAVPQPVFNSGKAQIVPNEEIILRFRSAIASKYQRFMEFIASGPVEISDSFVIAINTKRILNIIPETEVPTIVQSVLPFGARQARIDPKRMEVVDVGYQYRGEIIKQSGNPVSTTIFQDSEYSNLSAVWCSSVDCANAPSKFGSEFILVHNPNANKRIDLGTFRFGKEYWVEGSELRNAEWE